MDFYRIEAEDFDGEIKFKLLTFAVTKITPKGVWLSNKYGLRKFVLTKPGKRRFAHKSLDDALDGFEKRKKVYGEILKSKIEENERILKAFIAWTEHVRKEH